MKSAVPLLFLLGCQAPTLTTTLGYEPERGGHVGGFDVAHDPTWYAEVGLEWSLSAPRQHHEPVIVEPVVLEPVVIEPEPEPASSAPWWASAEFIATISTLLAGLGIWKREEIAAVAKKVVGK